MSSLISLFYTFGVQEFALDDSLHLMNVIRAKTAVNGDGSARLGVNVILHINWLLLMAHVYSLRHHDERL